MRTRNVFVQLLILVALSSVVAVVANAFAGRTRRLVLPGFYPHALRVPPRVPERVPPPPITETAALTATAATATAAPTATAVTATVAQSPAPGQPPIPVPTTTIERPAGATTSAPAATPSPTAPSTPAPPRVDLSRFFAPHNKPFVEISGEEAAALHGSGVLFLDARRTSVYEAGHIAGARSFSVWEADIDEKVTALFNERDDPEEQNKPIVIYCSGGACEDSHMLAEKLFGIQFNNVYVYKDGYPDWQKRNLPVRTGAQP